MKVGVTSILLIPFLSTGRGRNANAFCSRSLYHKRVVDIVGCIYDRVLWYVDYTHYFPTFYHEVDSLSQGIGLSTKPQNF